ncbi:MAG: leucyl aminopeptidase [Candidatus Omnitrophica bacterium]|nr:leucyl aminopeptidase [Candidatus Omnitrophota bacterium]
MIQSRPLVKLDKPAAVFLFAKEHLSKTKLPNVGAASLEKEIICVYKNGHFNGDAYQIFPLIYKKQIVILAGIGAIKKASPSVLRCAIRQAIVSPYLKKSKAIEVVPHDDEESTIKAVIEGILIGGYAWQKYQAKGKDASGATSVLDKAITVVTKRKKLCDDLKLICNGVALARDLVNDNADIITASYFEKTVKALIKEEQNISVEILNKKQLQAKGLNLHLAVNKGSKKEPKLIIVKYCGASKKDKYTALVGKGMTFDTGGLNLKPTGHIETMRCDMAGAATVLGVLKNTLTLKPKKNIIFAMGLAENAIGSESYKPGDVIKSYNGKTVEIANTDAEGRLVLADAISYIVKNYKPARIIDIATLTGACVVALGYDYTGLISNNDSMADQLRKAAEETDDMVWPLPSYPELENYVKSEIADIRNIGLPKGVAGTLTAAEFLRQFTDDTPWAHLDIAGTAFVEGKSRSYYGCGATGAGVRLLTYYVRNEKK